MNSRFSRSNVVDSPPGGVRESGTPAEFHVSIHGDDQGEGSSRRPWRTIQKAADNAMPGDTILIHAGTYRERIDPPRGGVSEGYRITYEAAGDGVVEIKGSEVVGGWNSAPSGVWMVEVDNALFGDDNPYQRQISGHWFYPKGREHHPGAVYFHGHWLVEAASLEEILNASSDSRLWFAEVGPEATRLHARFGGSDPADGLVEINVRKTVFYPSRERCNFITVRGLSLLHAATPWSPPTTEQIGLLGCHWAKGWIIDRCIVRYSACAGITLGKYNDPEDAPDSPVVERTNGEDTYHGTIRRAVEHGWDFDSIGGHVVVNTTVSHCEMAGICGSLSAIGSRIEGNTIHDIHVHKLFNCFEQAGIKFHAPIDCQIVRNRIFRCHRGIWLDWMTQGTLVTENLCYSNGPEPDLFVEVNHGPFTVQGNFFISEFSLISQSRGGIYERNVFLGRIKAIPEPNRVTPFFDPHSTRIAGWSNIMLGDDKYHSNIVAGENGLSDYNEASLPMEMKGNQFLNGSQPSSFELDAVFSEGVLVRMEEREKEVWLHGLVPSPKLIWSPTG